MAGAEAVRFSVRFFMRQWGRGESLYVCFGPSSKFLLLPIFLTHIAVSVPGNARLAAPANSCNFSQTPAMLAAQSIIGRQEIPQLSDGF